MSVASHVVADELATCNESTIDDNQGSSSKKSKKHKKVKKTKVDDNGNPIKKKKKSKPDSVESEATASTTRGSVALKMEITGLSAPADTHDDEDAARRHISLRRENSAGMLQLIPPTTKNESEPSMRTSNNYRPSSSTVPNLAGLIADEASVEHDDMEPELGYNGQMPLRRISMSATMDFVKDREIARRHAEHENMGTTTVPPPRRYSSASGSTDSNKGMTAPSRPGAVHVTSAARVGKEYRPDMTPYSEPYNGTPVHGALSPSVAGSPEQGSRRRTSSQPDNAPVRPGADSVATPAPVGKGSVPSMTLVSENYNGAHSRVGAISVNSAVSRGKGSGSSVTSGSQGYEAAPTRVGAAYVSSAAPTGKGSGPSMTRASENYDGTHSRVGAISVATAAPRRKGSGPALSIGSEEYGGATNRDDNSFVAGTPSAGNRFGPSPGSSIENFGGNDGRVGAVAVGFSAPSGKERRLSMGSSTVGTSVSVGAVTVIGAAPTGKGGASGLSVAPSLETYEHADLRVGAVPMPSAAPTGKGGRPRVGAIPALTGAQSRKGSGTPSQSERPRIGALQISNPVPQGKESAPAVFSAPIESSTRERARGRLNQDHFSSGEAHLTEMNDSSSMGRSRMENDHSGRDVRNRRRSSTRAAQPDSDSIAANSIQGDGSQLNSGSSNDGLGRRSGVFPRGSFDSRNAHGLLVDSRDVLDSSNDLIVARGGGLSDHQHDMNRHAGIGDYGESFPLDAEPGLECVGGVENLNKVAWFCSCWFKVGLLGLILVGAGTGAAVALTSDGDSEVLIGPPPSLAPSLGPIDKSRRDNIYDILKNVTGTAILDNITSPQYAALDWVARYDELTPISIDEMISVDQERLLVRYSLATFYYSTAGDNWFSSDGWLDGLEHECNWEFITCINDNRDIVKISTPTRNNFAGSIPSELQTIESLRELNFTNNELTAITPDIGTFSRLVILDLSSNKIEGTIPDSLFSLPNLSVLNLGSNKITGTISSNISALSSLGQLLLFDNLLTGKLTSELSLLSRLDVIDLNGNMMMGSVNDILSELTGLKIIAMGENEFTGTLTADFILQFGEMIQLDLGQTDLSKSTIPTEIGMLTTLESIALYGSTIEGSIPSELAQLVKLDQLSLEENSLTGSVPDDLCSVSMLKELRVDCTVPCPCDSCTFVVLGICTVSTR